MEISTDKVLEVAVPLIKRFEGLVLHPYLCSALVPTIGYGSTYYLDGRRVKLTDPPITQVQADILLKNSILTTYLPSVIDLCPGLETANQIAAILSWTYNLGVGNLKASTLRKVINKKEFNKVTEQLLKWNLAGGKVTRGLTIRRQAEADVFNKPI